MDSGNIVIAKPEHYSTQVSHNEEFLEELEKVAEKRYSDEDPEFMQEVERTMPPPPLIEPENRQQRWRGGQNNWHNGGHHNRYQQGGYHRNGNRYNDRHYRY